MNHSLPKTDNISRNVLQANSVTSIIYFLRILWITIWSIVSTLAAKCGTLVMILPHYSTFPTKKSLFYSLYRCYVRFTDDFPSLTLSLSSDSSDSFEIEEPFLGFLDGEGGFESKSATICV